MTLYRWLRNTHLVLGLFSSAFLLMYGVSAVQMAHNSWFAPNSQVTTSDVALAPGISDARVVARELMDNHGLRGEIQLVAAKPDGLSFRVVRPGTTDEIRYDPATGATSIRETRPAFIGMLNRLHHAVGVDHDYWPMALWGVFIGITSAALFVIGLTGVYLWFTLHQDRIAGVVILAGSLAYTIPLLVMLRSAL